MDKFIKYLEKIGVTESNRHARPEDEPPAVFYREKYGDADYFRNAPNFIYDGVIICLDYNADAPAEYFRELRTIENKIEKYANRYGYTLEKKIFSFSAMVSYTAHRSADLEKAEMFYSFRDASRNAVDNIIHLYNETGRADEINNTLIYGIMDEYGAMYNEFLTATATA